MFLSYVPLTLSHTHVHPLILSFLKGSTGCLAETIFLKGLLLNREVKVCPKNTQPGALLAELVFSLALRII